MKLKKVDSGGLSEYEIVDRFLSFWVSLESITSSDVKRDVDA